ncbi:hypothetical protein ACOSQ3_007525 [Xanthoceras sorbifolium]
MVGAYCSSSLPTTLSTIAAVTSSTKVLKLPLLTSNSPPLSPKKLTKRKNHLRPKILKTLPKTPILPQPPSTNPVIPIVFPPENDAVFDPPTIKTGGIVPAVQEFEETQVSETEGVATTECGVVSCNNIPVKSFLQIGLGLVGVFVLQTICSVWIMGRASSDERKKHLNALDKNMNGINKGNILVNNDVVYLDRNELEHRINEIRALAREARMMEAKEPKNVEEENDMVDENVNSKGRIGIGKEISARLVKVEKKLGSRNGKLPGTYLNNLDKFEDDEKAGEVDEKLVFKKKFKFRSPSSMSSRSDVKGFGSDDRNAYEKKKSGLARARDDSTKEISGTVDVVNNGSDSLITNVNSSQNDIDSSEKMQRNMEVENTATRFGTVQGTNQGRSSVEVTNSRQSIDFRMQNLQKFTEESQKTALKSDRDAVIGRNNGSKHSVLGNKSDAKSDLWWLKLPYVLAILMRRGPEHEEAGLFTLRSASQAQDQSQTPYTVAFENHGDANNFCYLLETFFEGLGDFNADIVPLPVKELHDAVKSNTKKVIVVKKGQLKLYAGQPFADVEMALHALIN